MSTEVFNECGRCLETDLAEIIQDENLDIVDDVNITAYDFANYVIYLSKVLRTYWLVDDEYKGMKIRIRNCLHGSVSVSNDNCTGVSDTLHYPFPLNDEDMFGAWLNLAQMINEAWYQCNN